MSKLFMKIEYPDGSVDRCEGESEDLLKNLKEKLETFNKFRKGVLQVRFFY